MPIIGTSHWNLGLPRQTYGQTPSTWLLGLPAQEVYAGASGNQTLTPALFTNTQTFYSPTVTQAGGTQTLTPSLFTNTQTFFAPVVTPGAVTLTPALFTNTQTFFAPTVTLTSGTQTLTPALFTNTQTFFAPTVTPRAVTLTPALFTNTQTFFTPTVTQAGATQTLTPDLFTNAQTFFAPVVTPSNTLTPELFTNTQTFFAPAVTSRYTLRPSLFTNTQTFFSPLVTAQPRTATQFDPRVYGAHQAVRFAMPGYTVDQQSFVAIPGDRQVVAFDRARRLTNCRDSGDLGGRPLAVAFVGGQLWAAVDTGETVAIQITPGTDEPRRVVLTPEVRIALQGRGGWITGGRMPALLIRVNHLGQTLVNDLGETRVGDAARSVVIAPYGQAGVATIDADTNVVLARRAGLMAAIYTVAYDEDTGRIYAFDDLGHLAILTVDQFGALSNFRFQDTRRVMGLRVDARVVNGRLVVCAHAYKRAYFFSLADPDAPALVETRDYRIDPFRDPVSALEFAGDPLVFAAGGDTFLDFAAWPTTVGREAGGNQRVYLHGGMGAVSFTPIAQATLGNADLGAFTVDAATADQPLFFGATAQVTWWGGDFAPLFTHPSPGVGNRVPVRVDGGWIWTSTSFVVKYNDDATQTTKASLGLYSAINVARSNASTLWALGYGSTTFTVWKSVDDGESWGLVSTMSRSLGFSPVIAAGPTGDLCIAALDYTGISIDGGLTWSYEIGVLNNSVVGPWYAGGYFWRQVTGNIVQRRVAGVWTPVDLDPGAISLGNFVNRLIYVPGYYLASASVGVFASADGAAWTLVLNAATVGMTYDPHSQRAWVSTSAGMKYAVAPYTSWLTPSPAQPGSNNSIECALRIIP